MFKLFLAMILISQACDAGLPPTTTKFSGDSNPVTTFNFEFPNISVTHSGVKATANTVNATGGGTGVSNPTAHQVPIAEGSSNFTFISPSTSGFVLTSNGTGSDPSFQAAAAASVVSPGTVRITSAYITYSAGTPTVTRQDGSWISSLTDNGTGDTTINVAGGTFSVAPNCTANAQDTTSARLLNFAAATTTSAIRTVTFNGASTAGDYNYYIICVGAQ